MTIHRNCFLLLLYLSAVLPGARADPPAITSIWPPSAVVGGATTLSIEGGNLAGCRLFVSGAGLTFGKAEALAAGRGVSVSLTVSTAASVGAHEVRAVSASGISRPASLWIGVFAQRAEVEPNDDSAHADRLSSTTTTVYGRLDRSGDQDCYSFDAKEGETWVADCVAKGLHSQLDPVIELKDAGGATVARGEAVRGVDPRLVVTVPRAGTYSVLVTDSGGRGGPDYEYLLTVGRPPIIQEFTPHAERAGKTVGLIVRGANLAGMTRARVAVPPDAEQAVWFSVRTPAGPSLPFLFPLSEEPAIAVTESDQTMAVPAVPSALEGKLEAFPFAQYYVDLEAGAHLQFLLLTGSIGSKLDAQLDLMGADARVIAATAAGSALSMPDHPKGRYVVQIRSRGNSVGPDSYYRLEVRTEEPGFRAAVARDGLVVVAGTVETLPITVTREGGFAGDVEVVAAGLPRGVALTGGRFPAAVDKKDLKLVVGTNATREPFLLRLRARGRVGGKLVDHMVHPSTTERGSVTTSMLLPVVVLPAPPPSRTAH